MLVQHNILWHAQSETEGEVLEVNPEECLMRLRYGRYVWLAEQLFGKAVRVFLPCPSDNQHLKHGIEQESEVLQLILDNGKLRLPDIVSQLSIYDPVHGPDSYTQATLKLLSNAYLKPATVLSHQSPRDKQLKYEAEEKAKLSGYPTAKDLRQAKETADARLKREEEEAEKVGVVSRTR